MKTTVSTQEFDRSLLDFIGFLEKAREQIPPSFDSDRLERIRKEVEELRLAAIEAEILAEYPELGRINHDLLEIIGTEPDLPLEEERHALAEAISQFAGRVDDSD